MEMASAYAAFATGRPPLQARGSSSGSGARRASSSSRASPKPKEATSPQATYVLLGMLRGVTQRGTAARRRAPQAPLAGKTGTTNDFTDAWFIGMTPKHTIAVWVGHDTKKTLGPKSAGADVALPIWMRIVERMKELGYVYRDGRLRDRQGTSSSSRWTRRPATGRRRPAGRPS